MKGFISAALVLALIPFIFQGLGVYNEVIQGTSQVKNQLVLQNSINSKTYQIEDEFRHAASKALRDGIALDMTSEAIEELACTELARWAQGTGCESNLDFPTCMSLLSVSKPEALAKIERKEWKWAGFSGFRFECKAPGAAFEVIIPEETVVR